MSQVTRWLESYRDQQCATYNSLPLDQVTRLIDIFRSALHAGAGIYVFGNGGSASNASHFVTDVGKGASDVTGSRFRIASLNENIAWMTAIGNDYSYEDVFKRQLENYARPGDIAFCMSVSGNSPNLLKAMRWARENQLITVALVGAKRGGLAEICEHVLVVSDTHYGRVEDAQMTICHMLAYAFMEKPEAQPSS